MRLISFDYKNEVSNHNIFENVFIPFYSIIPLFEMYDRKTMVGNDKSK